MTHDEDPTHNAALRKRIAELEATASHLRAEVERLRDSEGLFRTLVQGAFEGLVVSVRGKIVEANDVFATMSGYSRDELVGMTVADFVTPETAIAIMDRIRRGVETVYEVVAVRKDGSQIPVEILGREVMLRGEPARIGAFRDISERKRAEAEKRELQERMLAAEKLENIGMLAGGVAHDFNNLLLVILGHAELAQQNPQQGLTEHLDQIRLAAQRASELTKQMLTYAGRTPTKAAALDLSDLVRSMTELLRVTVKANATLRLEMTTDLPALEGDVTQLRQVVMNLISNASDALGDAPGTIRLRTEVCTLDAARLEGACLDATTQHGEHVYLECEDTGRGMDAATQARMFDPFFSTKFAGRGLGLASVLGIVRAHAGAIVVNSTPGTGTRISIYFPTSARKVVEDTAGPQAAPRPFSKQASVLVVDDERMIRVLTADMLRSAGLDVHTAHDGEEAVRVFSEHNGHIDIVVLDLTMPGMTGVQTLRALRALDANVHVILVSGFHELDVSTDASTSFLTKPFDMDALLEEIHAHLGAR